MNREQEDRIILDAVRNTYQEAELHWPPVAGGPIPLHRLIRDSGLYHQEVADLSPAVVSACLMARNIVWRAHSDRDAPLAGFLFANALGGYVFVRRGDGLPRRRFTAAHELGHYRLHLAPELARPDAELVRSDADETIAESGEAELDEMERQANRFAAELLMPEGVCRELHAHYSRKYGPVARFLVHHLAGELLVSRRAIAWRLYGLRLIDKPAWLNRGSESDEGREAAEAV